MDVQDYLAVLAIIVLGAVVLLFRSAVNEEKAKCVKCPTCHRYYYGK
jgi:hypothetical protein